MAPRQHAARRLLRHQESTEGRHGEGFFDVGGVEIDQWPTGAEACIVDDDAGRTRRGIKRPEQRLHVRAP